jgi:hypothetical protein
VSLFDLTDAIAELSSGAYTLRRPAAAVVVGGRVQAATFSDSAITGSLQPAGGRELQRLPEGLRQREARVFFTPTELRAGSSTTQPDRLVIDGDEWEVSTVEAWAELGGYYQAIVTRDPP